MTTSPPCHWKHRQCRRHIYRVSQCPFSTTEPAYHRQCHRDQTFALGCVLNARSQTGGDQLHWKLLDPRTRAARGQQAHTLTLALDLSETPPPISRLVTDTGYTGDEGARYKIRYPQVIVTRTPCVFKAAKQSVESYTRIAKPIRRKQFAGGSSTGFERTAQSGVAIKEKTPSRPLFFHIHCSRTS